MVYTSLVLPWDALINLVAWASLAAATAVVSWVVFRCAPMRMQPCVSGRQALRANASRPTQIKWGVRACALPCRPIMAGPRRRCFFHCTNCWRALPASCRASRVLTRAIDVQIKTPWIEF
jgi:hypothetical protein